MDGPNYPIDNSRNEAALYRQTLSWRSTTLFINSPGRGRLMAARKPSSVTPYTAALTVDPPSVNRPTTRPSDHKTQ